jgi:hypothetical protein
MSKFQLGFVSFLITLAYALPAHAAKKAQTTTDYWAQFEWRDGRKMQLVIFEKSAHHAFAQIQTLDGKALASCDVKPLDNSAIDMTCKSSGFSPLTSHAALYIGERQGKKAGILRFGTWLSGYEQAVLEVKIDRSNRLRAPVLAVERKGTGEYTPMSYATY